MSDEWEYPAGKEGFKDTGAPHIPLTGTLPVLGLQWRNPYNDAENEFHGELTAVDYTGDPGLTQQAPAEEQDINVIMKRFGVKDGSVLPYWMAPAEMYNDVSDVPNDPVEAQEYLRQGELAFMQLPAEIRQRFNSGAHFYHWINDDRNTDEARSLGLLNPKVLSSNTSSHKGPTGEPSKEDEKNETP